MKSGIANQRVARSININYDDFMKYLISLLTLFIGLIQPLGAFSEPNGEADNSFEQSILKSLNIPKEKHYKILVYLGKDCFVEKRNPHSVIELFSVLERRAIPQISATFATSIAQFDLNNLRKFDCVVLVSAAKDFFDDSVVKSLPRVLLENEKKKSEKYALNLKTYIEEGGALFLVSSEIPRVLNVQYGNIAHSKDISNIPIFVKNHFITKGLWEREDRFLIQDNMAFNGEDFDAPKNIQAILSLDPEYFPPAKREIPVAWSMDYSKGKILSAPFSANKNLFENNADLLGFYVRCLNYAFNGSSSGAGEARVAYPETSIVYLRFIEDESSDIYQSVSRKINEFISKNPNKKDSIGNLCINDLKKNIGTCLYKKFLSEILLRTSLKSESDALIKEIQVLSSDMNNKKCVRNLITAVGESKDAKRVENLEKLLYGSNDYIVLNSLRAISKIRDPKAISIAKTHSYGILKDDSKSKELKEQAVKSLLEIGEHVDLSLISKDSIGYL